MLCIAFVFVFVFALPSYAQNIGVHQVDDTPVLMVPGQADSTNLTFLGANSTLYVCTKGGTESKSSGTSIGITGNKSGTVSATTTVFCGMRFSTGATAPTPPPALQPTPSTATVTVTYVHTDALGSPVARTDEQGRIISRTRFDPYGATVAGAPPSIGFTGHVNAPDTGLIYMQQRYYDPMAGRFMSIDPVRPNANTGGSFNLYVYVFRFV